MEHCDVIMPRCDGSVLNCDVMMSIVISQWSTVMSKCNTVVKMEHCYVITQQRGKTVECCGDTMDHSDVIMWHYNGIMELLHVIMLKYKIDG